MFVLFLTTFLLYNFLKNGNVSLVTPIFVLMLGFVLISLVDEGVARNNALQYQHYALDQYNEQLEAEVAAARAEQSGGAALSGPAHGKTVYETYCIACHDFNEKRIGPAYMSVLEKYDGKLDELTEYIINPSRVNPDEYPAPMMNTGWSDNDAKAAAEYLLEEYGKRK
jgi:cytochrome c551/c552